MDGATVIFRFIYYICKVGGCVNTVEVLNWFNMEVLIVQILVVVAIILMKIQKTGEEKGFTVKFIFSKLVGILILKENKVNIPWPI